MNTIKFYSVVDTNEIILFAVKMLKSIATQCSHTYTENNNKNIFSLMCESLL